MKSCLEKRNKRNYKVWLYLCGLVFVWCLGCAYFVTFAPFFEKRTELFISDRHGSNSFEEVLGEHSSIIKVQVISLIGSIFGDGRIHQGHYCFSNESLLRVYRRLSMGYQDPVSFSFNNVRTMEQFARRVDRLMMIDSAQFMSKVNDQDFLNELGFSRQTLPALFIPNKYEIFWDISIDQFFDRMLKEHHSFWNATRKGQLKRLNLSLVEAVTLASIVEEETNDSEDRSIIAGLYLNRIKVGMPLQACPTVRFAHNDYSINRVYNHHTQIESPYNTYKHRGLPPGPIRIASIKSIDAVLQASANDFLYMCAKEDFSGKHRFASSYSEHLRNARLYQRAYDLRYKKE